MIHPESRARGLWDYSILAVTIIAAVEIPLALVFDLTSLATVRSIGWAVSIVFVTDIVVIFNTAFFSQRKLVENRRLVTRRYLSGWFWLDLCSALPIGVVLATTAAAGPDAGTLMGLLTLNPLLKLLRIGKTLRRIGQSRVNPAILRLALLVFWILLAAHLVSCGWILISGDPDRLLPVDRYIRSFYWTMTTLTTIGYGDITPDGRIQILFVVAIEMLGAGMYGLVIGNIANLIANIDVAKTQYKEKMDRINAFLKYRSIPLTLQQRINDYYGYLWESRRGYDESTVLGDLPGPLKVSVSLFLNKEILEKVPIFDRAGEDLIRDMAVNLEPVVFTPGDYIVRAGEMGYDMFFISRGAVDVVSADERTTYATLREGHFFGEIALLLSTPRTATIRATEYCDLYRLDKETFDHVIGRHPEFAERIQELAESRRAELDATKTERMPVPGQVDGISVTRVETGVRLQWREVDGPTRYEVVRFVPHSGKWRYLTREATEPTVLDETDISEESSTYRVRAVNATGPGPWSRPTVIRGTPQIAAQEVVQ